MHLFLLLSPTAEQTIEYSIIIIRYIKVNIVPIITLNNILVNIKCTNLLSSFHLDS